MSPRQPDLATDDERHRTVAGSPQQADVPVTVAEEEATGIHVDGDRKRKRRYA